MEQKLEGNKFFREGKFEEAIQEYLQVLTNLKITDVEKSKVYSNLASCHFKLKNYSLSLCDVEKALKLKPKWEKPHFRKIMCYNTISQHENACRAIISYLETLPNDVRKSIVETDTDSFIFKQMRICKFYTHLDAVKTLDVYEKLLFKTNVIVVDSHGRGDMEELNVGLGFNLTRVSQLYHEGCSIVYIGGKYVQHPIILTAASMQILGSGKVVIRNNTKIKNAKVLGSFERCTHGPSLFDLRYSTAYFENLQFEYKEYQATKSRRLHSTIFAACSLVSIQNCKFIENESQFCIKAQFGGEVSMFGERKEGLKVDQTEFINCKEGIGSEIIERSYLTPIAVTVTNSKFLGSQNAIIASGFDKGGLIRISNVDVINKKLAHYDSSCGVAINRSSSEQISIENCRFENLFSSIGLLLLEKNGKIIIRNCCLTQSTRGKKLKKLPSKESFLRRGSRLYQTPNGILIFGSNCKKIVVEKCIFYQQHHGIDICGEKGRDLELEICNNFFEKCKEGVRIGGQGEVVQASVNIKNSTFKENERDVYRNSFKDSEPVYSGNNFGTGEVVNVCDEKLRKKMEKFSRKVVSRGKKERKKNYRKHEHGKDKNLITVLSCNNCKRLEEKNERFKVCGRCKGTRYCSKKCQVEHWRLGHKRECSNKARENDKFGNILTE